MAIGLAAATSVAHAAVPARPSACERLATFAQTVPEQAWTKGENALRPALAIEHVTPNPVGTAAKIIGLPDVLDAIDARYSSGFIARLPGTNVYMAASYGGSAACESSAFVKAGPDGHHAIIPGPAGMSDDWEGDFGQGMLCWNQKGDVGVVFSRPAYIEHGTAAGFSIDEVFRIAPWTGSGWGAPCGLRLDFRHVFTLKSKHCGDQAVCDAGADAAVAMATEYNRLRDKNESLSHFSFGGAITPATQAAVARARAVGDLAAFPTFGAKDDPRQFSYSGFALFALALGEKQYVGAIGRDGVGWREDSATLIVIFNEDSGALTPLASYVVDMSNGGLAKTTLSDTAK